MTYYREATDDEVDLAYRDDTKVKTMRVVPVEPCEHGNIYEHVVRGNSYCLDCGPAEWCPGAGIGGSE